MIIYSMLVLLLSNAVTLRRDKSILYSRATIIIFLCTCLLVEKSLSVTFLDRGVGLYGGLFNATPITHTFHLFIFFISAIILQLTAFYPRKVWVMSLPFKALLTKSFTYDTNLIGKQGGQFRIIEYPLILTFIVIGGTFLVSASDIVSIFLSIELQSYGLYLLSTLYRNSELATSAGLTYFLLGGLSSCFILLGTSLLYASSGTTSLDGYYVLTGLSSLATASASASASASDGLSMSNPCEGYNPLYLNVSLLIMSVGFLFKISAAPFHFWSPDVYDAIPTIVTTFVAIVAKISILVLLLETTHYTSSFFSAFSFSWTSGLLFSSFSSLIIGSVLGLTQFRIKRLFAYSTISHLGFILLALCINSLESIQGFLFYLMVYSISNLNAFIILITIGFSLYPFVNSAKGGDLHLNDGYSALRDRNNSPIQLIDQIKGYFSLNPVLALSLGITLFSFVGIPPLAGFFAKQMVLSAALDSGYVALALIAILTSVVSAVYYLGVIKQVAFDSNSYYRDLNLQDNHNHTDSSTIIGGGFGGGTFTSTRANSTSKILLADNESKAQTANVEEIVASFSLTVTISILTLVLLTFLFTPQESLSMTSILALTLFNP